MRKKFRNGKIIDMTGLLSRTTFEFSTGHGKPVEKPVEN